MNKLFLALTSASLLFACSKDQKVVKNLEGEWEVTKYIAAGEVVEFVSSTMEFESCKLKEDDCDGKWEITDSYIDFNGNSVTDTEIFNLTYHVSEGGNEMFMTLIDSDNWVETFECDMELDGDDLTLEFQVEDEMYELELERDN